MARLLKVSFRLGNYARFRQVSLLHSDDLRLSTEVVTDRRAAQ